MPALSRDEELPRAIAQWFLTPSTLPFNSPESVRQVVSHEFGENLKEDVIAEIIAIMTADEERRDI